MKERVTLTLEKDILDRVDSTINGETIKNRSHAVELLLRQVLRGRVPKVAIILAGGPRECGEDKGETPKTLSTVQGQTVLQHNIDLLKRFGVTHVMITIGKHGDKVKKLFGDGSGQGLEISYIEEPEPRGTAGCLYELKGKIKEPFLVMNGDELKDVNLAKLFEAHNQNQAVATIALTTVEDPSSYGVAMLDGNRILRFVEKPKKEDAPSKLINAGIYVLEPEVIHMIPEGFAMFEINIFPILASHGKLYGYPFSGQWFDTGTPTDLKKTDKEWKGFTT